MMEVIGLRFRAQTLPGLGCFVGSAVNSHLNFYPITKRVRKGAVGGWCDRYDGVVLIADNFRFFVEYRLCLEILLLLVNV